MSIFIPDDASSEAARHPMENAPQTLSASALFPTIESLNCIECDQQMELRDGVTYHLGAGDVSGHDIDADHVAIAPEDDSEVVTCASLPGPVRQ